MVLVQVIMVGNHWGNLDGYIYNYTESTAQKMIEAGIAKFYSKGKENLHGTKPEEKIIEIEDEQIYTIKDEDIYKLDKPIDPPSTAWDTSIPNELNLKEGYELKRTTHNIEVKPIIKYTEDKELEEIRNVIVFELEEHFNVPTIINSFLKKIPFYYDTSKIWWVWNTNELVWKMVDETDILVLFTSTYKTTGIHRRKLQNEIIDYLKIESRKLCPKIPPPNLIQFGKIIYDINTGINFESTSEYFFTNSVPFTPSISDETPTFDLLFDSWVGRENRETLYEIIAYCCYRDYPIHHLFCFIGSGSNGKSTFLSILQKFLGINNCCSTSLDTLMISRFESANLYKKLVCLMGETNFNVMSKTETLKKLTGQDLISFEFKNKMPFSDTNYSKLIISTNTLPETTDRTDGFYRRWVTIDFPNRFSGELDILSTIPEYEFNNLSRKVLNILPNLLSFRRFHNVGTLEDRKRKYEERSNPLPKFLELNTLEDIDSVVYKWEFKEKYNVYLKQNNLRSQSDTEIGIRLKDLGFEDKRISVDGKTNRVWVGLKWKDLVTKISSETIDVTLK